MPEIGGMPGLSKTDSLETDYSSDSNSANLITDTNYEQTVLQEEMASMRQIIQTLSNKVRQNEQKIQGNRLY